MNPVALNVGRAVGFAPKGVKKMPSNGFGIWQSTHWPYKTRIGSLQTSCLGNVILPQDCTDCLFHSARIRIRTQKNQKALVALCSVAPHGKCALQHRVERARGQSDMASIVSLSGWEPGSRYIDTPFDWQSSRAH